MASWYCSSDNDLVQVSASGSIILRTSLTPFKFSSQGCPRRYGRNATQGLSFVGRRLGYTNTVMLIHNATLVQAQIDTLTVTGVLDIYPSAWSFRSQPTPGLVLRVLPSFSWFGE